MDKKLTILNISDAIEQLRKALEEVRNDNPTRANEKVELAKLSIIYLQQHLTNWMFDEAVKKTKLK